MQVGLQDEMHEAEYDFVLRAIVPSLLEAFHEDVRGKGSLQRRLDCEGHQVFSHEYNLRQEGLQRRLAANEPYMREACSRFHTIEVLTGRPGPSFRDVELHDIPASVEKDYGHTRFVQIDEEGLLPQFLAAELQVVEPGVRCGGLERGPEKCAAAADPQPALRSAAGTNSRCQK